MPRTKRTAPAASQFIDDEAAEVAGSDESPDEFTSPSPSRKQPPGAPLKKKFRPSLRMQNTMKKLEASREASPEFQQSASAEVPDSPRSGNESPPPFRKLQFLETTGPATPPVQINKNSKIFSLGPKADVLIYFE